MWQCLQISHILTYCIYGYKYLVYVYIWDLGLPYAPIQGMESLVCPPHAEHDRAVAGTESLYPSQQPWEKISI